jgi:hypothetical protein
MFRRSLICDMSTRKLILTALICGLAIMLAGGAKLFLMVRDDVTVSVFDLGTTRTLSDMTVSVDKVVQDPAATYITVTMQGVNGASATEGWRLLAGGKVISPAGTVPQAVGVACGTTQKSVSTQCVVAFPVTDGSLTVAYLRAGTQSQWAA